MKHLYYTIRTEGKPILNYHFVVNLIRSKADIYKLNSKRFKSIWIALRINYNFNMNLCMKIFFSVCYRLFQER